jgi:excisionase family DNA binding protein
MTEALLEPVAPSAADAEIAGRTSRQFSKFAVAGRSLRMTPQNGGSEPTETIEIPAGAVPLIQRVLAAMAKGEAVAIVPVHAEVTTQQAAGLLGVSRPFVIKLLDERAIPFRKVGRHRRIVLQDLLQYKRAIHEQRQRTLDELSAESQKLGIGY